MAFVKIDKVGRGPYAGSEREIRFGSRLADGKLPRNVYVSVAPEIVREVGWTEHHPMVRPSDPDRERRVVYIEINEGVDEDAGFWLFSEATDTRRGYSLGTSKGGMFTAYNLSVSVSKLKHYVLNDVEVSPDAVEFTIDEKDKTILIQCPDWLRFNPLSMPDKPEPPGRTEQIVKSPSVPLVRVDTIVDTSLGMNREQRRAVAKKIVRAIRS